MRIYWKHFDLDKDEVGGGGASHTEDVEMSEGQREYEKSFYLYCNNMMKELVYEDLEAILPYVCFRVKEKVNLGLHYMSQEPEKMQ